MQNMKVGLYISTRIKVNFGRACPPVCTQSESGAIYFERMKSPLVCSESESGAGYFKKDKMQKMEGPVHRCAQKVKVGLYISKG